MITFKLHGEGMIDWRFALSPLHATVDLLFFHYATPGGLPRQWHAAANDTLTDKRLRLLALLMREGGYGCIPNFLTPPPTTFEPDPQDETHDVAATPAGRVAFEMAHLINRSPWPATAAACAPPDRPVWALRALDRGEAKLAEDLAGQLALAYRLLIEPSWSRIRDRLEADVTRRTRDFARHGLTGMLAGLNPQTCPAPGALSLAMTTPVEATVDVNLGPNGAVVLIPSAFGRQSTLTIDPPGIPDGRAAIIGYPSAVTAPPGQPCLSELIGATRAEVLSELRTPQSTDHLARKLHLSRSTVSYHLQILFRAGLVLRVRDGHTVYYHAAPVASAHAV
jgi:DNA-binding transcriptional ArsR family regulator